jgi:hypothetical protein
VPAATSREFLPQIAGLSVIAISTGEQGDALLTADSMRLVSLRTCFNVEAAKNLPRLRARCISSKIEVETALYSHVVPILKGHYQHRA